MTEHDAGTTNEAHEGSTEPEAPADLHLEDEAAEHVVGGDNAQTSPEQYRGRYQLRLGG
jgi:hypothetical protein